MRSFCKVALFSFLTASVVSSAGPVDPVTRDRATGYLTEYGDAILVNLYKDRLPAIYETYLGIREKQKQVVSMRQRLRSKQNNLSAEGPRNVIRKKIDSLIAYEKELNKCIFKLEECAYEKILVGYVFKVAPSSINQDIRSHMEADVEKELDFAGDIMKQIDQIHAD